MFAGSSKWSQLKTAFLAFPNFTHPAVGVADTGGGAATCLAPKIYAYNIINVCVPMQN